MTANERIELEKQRRTGTLDVGRWGLTELPDLSDMDWLEALIVSNRWWDLGQRKWINSHNSGKLNRTRIPPRHPLPPSLKKLILGADQYGYIWGINEFGFLGNLTGLTTLDLSFYRISDVSFLRNLTGLTSLSLSERNDHFQENKLGIYLKLENWEAMSATMSATRKQDDYNQRILESDISICLVHTKVGKYTEEEFNVAWARFQKTQKPLILIYFKDDKVHPDAVQQTRSVFKLKLEEELNHFPDGYNDYAELEGKVAKEIERFLLNGGEHSENLH